MSRFFKTAAVAAAMVSVAGAANANCGNSPYCSSSNYTSSMSSYGTSGFSTTMTPIEANSKYGSGSISHTYSDNSNVQYFSGSSASAAGLGYGESLQSTSCPVNVYGASSDAQVLGCYNVVKPVARTSYYRVVRPVVYVRYPVPVAVPYISPCLSRVEYSRYGDMGYRGHGHAAHHRGGCR